MALFIVIRLQLGAGSDREQVPTTCHDSILIPGDEGWNRTSKPMCSIPLAWALMEKEPE